MGDAMRDGSSKRKLAVIGNGMAGARFVEEMVARGGRELFDIVVFGDEPYGNYNRIRLSDVIAGNADASEIFLNPLSWYEANGIKVHAGTRVHGIDRKRRVLHAHNGVLERYDVLVIATGSSAAVPPLERLRLDDGTFREGAFVFRTLDDCEAMATRARTSKKAVVIGGGLLGLEAARGLAAHGLEVHVVHLMKHLMEVQLDQAAAKILQREIEARGIVVHLGKATCGVIGDPGVEGVLFADGKTLDCDLLVIATGIRPNTQLAIDAGLNVERGIVVDDAMRTEDDAIYAVGECAQHRDRCYGLVAPLWDQVKVLADRLTGKNPNAEYTGSKLSTKLKVAGIDLTVMGDRDPDDDDEVVTYSEPARGVYKKMLVRDGKLAGAILLGDASNAPSLLEAFASERLLPETRAEMLFAIAAETARPSLAALKDDAQICNCNGVSKGAIVAAVKDGCTSLKMVCDATRAGAGCGGCKGDVEQLVQLQIQLDDEERPLAPLIPMRRAAGDRR
jgi:nitrite reductase (NADH) large subunit